MKYWTGGPDDLMMLMIIVVAVIVSMTMFESQNVFQMYRALFPGRAWSLNQTANKFTMVSGEDALQTALWPVANRDLACAI